MAAVIDTGTIHASQPDRKRSSVTMCASRRLSVSPIPVRSRCVPFRMAFASRSSGNARNGLRKPSRSSGGRGAPTIPPSSRPHTSSRSAKSCDAGAVCSTTTPSARAASAKRWKSCRVSRSARNGPSVSTHASRSPFNARGSAAPSGGTGGTSGLRRSAPSMRDRMSRRSATERASGPEHAMWRTWRGPSGMSGMWPALETRSSVGLMLTMPQKCAGSRTEPPMSLPTSNGVRPAATAADAPPLEPPGVRVRSCGLWARPSSGPCVW
ncbi:hypothetical protein COSO111634_37990 [Corallococcus soli]